MQMASALIEYGSGSEAMALKNQEKQCTDPQ